MVENTLPDLQDFLSGTTVVAVLKADPFFAGYAAWRRAGKNNNTVELAGQILKRHTDDLAAVEVAQGVISSLAAAAERAIQECGAQLTPGQRSAYVALAPLVGAGLSEREAAQVAAQTEDERRSPETLRRYYRDAKAVVDAAA